MVNRSTPHAWDSDSLGNTNSDPDSPVTEPMLAGNTNDVIRDTRAAFHRYLNDTVYGIITTGDGSTYVVETEQTIDTLFDRFPICIIPHVNCENSPVVDLNTIGEIPLKLMDGGAIPADYLVADTPYLFLYYENDDQLRLAGPITAEIQALIDAAAGIVFGTLADFINATDDVALTGKAIWDSAAQVLLTMDPAIAVDMKNVTGHCNFKLSATLNTDTTISIGNQRVGASFSILFTCDGSARIWTFPAGSLTRDGFAADRKKTFAAGQTHMASCYVPQSGMYVWGFEENLRELTA